VPSAHCCARSFFGTAATITAGMAHPVPGFFHLLFKSLAIIVYLFGSIVSSSFVNIFIVCILLLAFDFWTVKNVTGRLMVGLRWNSEVQEDGSTTWKFESAGDQNINSTTLDSAVFWVGLFAPGLVWLLLGVRLRERRGGGRHLLSHRHLLRLLPSSPLSSLCSPRLLLCTLPSRRPATDWITAAVQL
jgi:hypothetical protein